MVNGAPHATYLFDDQCRITEQQKDNQHIHWLYDADKKTAEIMMNGQVTGRNIFEYRNGELSRILFYDKEGSLLQTIRLEPQPAQDFFLREREEKEPVSDLKSTEKDIPKLDARESEKEASGKKTEKHYRMEAEDMLELGK